MGLIKYTTSTSSGSNENLAVEMEKIEPQELTLFFFASLYLIPNEIYASIFAGWRKFSLKIWLSDLLAIVFNLKLNNMDTTIYASFFF